MKRAIVCIIFIAFIADVIYKNFFEKNTPTPLQSYSQIADHQKSSPTSSNTTKDNTTLSYNNQSQEEPIEEKKQTKGVKAKREKSSEEDDEFEGELPDDLPIDALKIVYCKNSHEKYYQMLSSYIAGNYTSIKITGEPYPIPNNKEQIAKGLMASQIILILFIFGSDYFKPFLPFIPEKVYTFIGASRLLFVVSCYLFHTYFINLVKSTGAFEVYANNRLVWSKLNQNALPSYDDIIRLLAL